MAKSNTQSQSSSPAAGAVGFVLPYCHGGTEGDNGHPVLLVPAGQPGPAGASSTVYGKTERPEGIEWAKGPQVTINGQTFDTYGSQGGKKAASAQKLLDSYLGDALARASTEDAKRMIANDAKARLAAFAANARKARPDLAEMTDEELLRMLLA